MRAAGCWKQTPGLLFSEEKMLLQGRAEAASFGQKTGGRFVRPRRKKKDILQMSFFFGRGRLKLIFPLNETAAQRCELALTYKKIRSKRYKACSDVEQGTGVEPAFSAWEADALPMSNPAIQSTKKV